MTKIYVVDALMGTGKTSAVMRFLEDSIESTEDRFLYISPFRKDMQNLIERVSKVCTKNYFYTPELVEGSLLNGFKKLLRERKNIASTHALFKRYDEEVLELLKEGRYHLIIDEAMDCLEDAKLPVHPLSWQSWMDYGIITENKTTGLLDIHLDMVDETFFGYDFLKELDKYNVAYDNGHTLLFKIPINRFDVFKDVMIMTYMFKYSIQYYYFISDRKKYTIKYRYVGKDERGFKLVNQVKDAVVMTPDPSLFNIIDGGVNQVGRKRALSKKWFETKDKDDLKESIDTVVHDIWQCKESDLIWTVFKNYREEVGGSMDGFLSCGARSTNDYIDRHHVIYGINRYMNTNLPIYFKKRGVDVDQDMWALQDMLQWIYRSAVRKGEPINLYIPSERMRGLLKMWLNGEGDIKELERFVGQFMASTTEVGDRFADVVSRISHKHQSFATAKHWVEENLADKYKFTSRRKRMGRVIKGWVLENASDGVKTIPPTQDNVGEV